MSRRTERVNFTLRRELGALISEELNDPRLAQITSVTHVDVSPDLKTARVYISVLGDDAEKAASMEALESAAGLLRNALRDRIRIRYTPSLRFLPDTTIEAGAEMLALIDQVADEDRRRGLRDDEAS
ncbi:MAG: 30S ribosome-binding factor RbfA [Dehalococcoidia bacterium]